MWWHNNQKSGFWLRGREAVPHGKRVYRKMVRVGGAEADLWDQTCEFFVDEDGSLPEVRLEGLSPDGVQAAFEELTSMADSEDPLAGFMTTIGGDEVEASSVPDLGRRAAEGSAKYVHFVLTGLGVEGILLPDLGVALHEGGVSLDYHPGPQWDATKVAASVKLLARLRQAAGEGHFTAGPGLQDYPEETIENFRRAIRQYLAQA